MVDKNFKKLTFFYRYKLVTKGAVKFIRLDAEVYITLFLLLYNLYHYFLLIKSYAVPVPVSSLFKFWHSLSSSPQTVDHFVCFSGSG